MGLDLKNLDDRTRELMADEIGKDIEAKNVYLSGRLTPEGEIRWIDLLLEAVNDHDDDWLASQLTRLSLIRDFETRRKPTGGTTQARIPANAPDTLAQGEFNRYYIRALCRYAIDVGLDSVVVYRARHSSSPRRESEELIGKKLAPGVVLNDLRSAVGVDTALGVPPGPNSGLSVCLETSRSDELA